MGELLNNFKSEAASLLRNKKNLINLLILSILVLAIPLVTNVVQQQKILQSRANVDAVVFVASDNVSRKSDGTWVAKKAEIDIQLTSPLGPAADSQSAQSKSSMMSFLPQGLVKDVYAFGASDCDSRGGLDTTAEDCDPAIGKKVQVFVCKNGERLPGSVTETSCSGSNPGSGTVDPKAIDCKTTIQPSDVGINSPTVCDRLHDYVLVNKNGTSASGCASADTCSNNDQCPKNPDTNHVPNNSNWCYGFKDGVARCIQLKYTGADVEPGCSAGEGSGGPNGCSNLDACSKCVLTTRPDILPFYAKNGWDTSCNNMAAVVTDWCKIDSAGCQSVKSGQCSSQCGSGGPAPSASSGTTNPNSLTCTISGSSSVAKGSKATFVATSNDTRIRTMEIYYNSNDRSAGGDYKKIATCNTDVTGLSGGCKGEIDTSVIPADKEGFTALCNAYAWKPREDGKDNCNVGNNDPIHCQPANVNWKADACTGNPLWSTSRDFGWSGCGSNSHKEISLTAPAEPAVTTTHFRIAEDLTDLEKADWKPYTKEIASKPYNFKFTNTAPGVKTIFVQFKDSKDNVTNSTNCPKCQASIKLLGGDPAMTSCTLDFEGNNAVLNLRGKNFGSNKGSIKSGEKSLEVKNWKDDSIQAVYSNVPTGEMLPVSFTNEDGQSGIGQCSAISRLSLGAKVFCRAPAAHDTDNVDLVLAGAFEGGTKERERVKLDKNGVIQGLTKKLEVGKNYYLSIKAPKSLRKTVLFTAGGGTTTIPNFVLPVGDISPADGGDGKIGLFDKAELNRQWIISQESSGRTADFNKDGRVNAIDWACMRYDYGKSDDSEPIAGAPDAPLCGGIANIKCPTGYNCKLEGNYPDASGKCEKAPQKDPIATGSASATSSAKSR